VELTKITHKKIIMSVGNKDVKDSVNSRTSYCDEEDCMMFFNKETK
jgi:hypothetical protein